MSTSIALKHHREEEEAKLASFRQKRLAKKLADREKLEAEFPLIFGNKQKGVVNYPSKYTTKVGNNTPGKRKASVINDENVENGAHPSLSILSNTLPPKPSNIPTSAKKAKLSSTAPLSSSQPLTPSKKASSIPVTTKPAKRNIFSFVFSSKPKNTPVNETNSTSTQFTASNTIVQPVVENIILPVPEPVEAVVEESTVVMEEPIVPALLEDTVEEKVLDVLDYLLESNELDEPTHRRLSKQSFSRTDIKRLSLSATMVPNKRVSFFLPSSHNSLAGTPEKFTTNVNEEEDIMMEETAVQINNTEEAVEIVECDIGELDTLYEPVSEECEIGDMDVLFALRNYISTLDPTPVKKTPLKEQTRPVPSQQPTEEVEETVESQEKSLSEELEESGEKFPTDTTSDNTEETVEESMDESSSDSEKSNTSSANTIASDKTVMEHTLHTTSTEEAEEEEETVPTYVSLDSVSLNLSGRKSMFRRRMSVDEGIAMEMEHSTEHSTFTDITGTSLPVISAEESVGTTVSSTVEEESISTTESTSTTDTPHNTTTSTTSTITNTIITYPRTEAIQFALAHAMVKVNVIGFIETGDHHIQYMVDVVIPSALTEEGALIPSMRMFLLKRFSEFKEFRQELCATILPEHFLAWQYAGEQMESIPPLKTRHSSLCNKLEREEKKAFYQGRQELLTIWFTTILSNAKMLQNPDYRMKIQEFFSC